MGYISAINTENVSHRIYIFAKNIFKCISKVTGHGVISKTGDTHPQAFLANVSYPGYILGNFSKNVSHQYQQ